jgi:lysophospholipase L1-like esterase
MLKYKQIFVLFLLLVVSICNASDLVAYYSFGVSSKLGKDYSGNGNNLIAYEDIPPSFSPDGKEGGAAHFDGSTQGFLTPVGIQPKGAFSIATWVKLDTVDPSRNQQIITVPFAKYSGFQLKTAWEPVRFCYGTYHSSGGEYINPYITASENTWTHLAMTYQPASNVDSNGNYSGTLKAYVDGYLVKTQKEVRYRALDTNKQCIGRKADNYFSGFLDEFRLYDNALSHSEIAELSDRNSKVVDTDEGNYDDCYGVEFGEHAAVSPVPKPHLDWWLERHKSIKRRVQQDEPDLIFIGDSITHRWEPFRNAENGFEIWKQYYAKRNALNMGFGGDRTQHVLWRMLNGEIDGINPELAVLLVGTNNCNDKDTPPEQIADGIKSVICVLKNKLPDTRILVLGIFPRGSFEQRETENSNAVYNWQWEKIDKINELVSKVSDNKRVYYLNINEEFLNDNGELTRQVMPDLIHLGKKGFKIWAEAMEPTISKLLKN